MTVSLVDLARRAARKPPRVIAMRLIGEGRAQAGRFLSPLEAKLLGPAKLATVIGAADIDDAWRQLASRPYVARSAVVTPELCNVICPEDSARLEIGAQRALARTVDLLGSGPIALGNPIDWHKDYKTGKIWPLRYCRDIDYNNPGLPSDVKMAWEISRMQWLIPAGQAYVLTRDERYARCVRDVVDDWIAANPYYQGVNWACTMEVALRIVSWTWFFHVFQASVSWNGCGFRTRFLRALYLHGVFTERHLERSGINGNHYTADAAGLVFAGLFFQGDAAERWRALGWKILCDEIAKQVYPDGVDFEASIPYHRLVFELFFLPALYRMAAGLDVPAEYRDRLARMSRFVAAYSREDGSVPLWGDADDARALPFGGQTVNDHLYVCGLAGIALNDPASWAAFAGPRSELLWLLGSAAGQAPAAEAPSISSIAFPQGGFYIMRARRDHVFIDCGPVGTGGVGGHGHNDCLSFEAVLDGVRLVSDCGAYLYTASYEERNRFRSTAFHNTPRIDGEELNRFVRPDYLWSLHNDARPEVREWKSGRERTVFRGSHSGYDRVGVRPVRTIMLEHAVHTLTITDQFEGEGEHSIEIPLHLAPGVVAERTGEGCARLTAEGRQFVATWSGASEWNFEMQPCRISPSYGVVQPATRLAWTRSGTLQSLTLRFGRV